MCATPTIVRSCEAVLSIVPETLMSFVAVPENAVVELEGHVAVRASNVFTFCEAMSAPFALYAGLAHEVVVAVSFFNTAYAS